MPKATRHFVLVGKPRGDDGFYSSGLREARLIETHRSQLALRFPYTALPSVCQLPD